MSYLEQRRKFIQDGRPLPQRKKYSIPKVSKKRAQKIAEEKEQRSDDKTEKQKWFNDQRAKISEYCGCGCGKRTLKHDDKKFWFSVAHVFPQRIFKSVQFHQNVWVSRAWDCHTNMDNRSMDRWPDMADWEQIKEIFFDLSSLLTEEERKKKFYRQFEKLVYAN